MSAMPDEIAACPSCLKPQSLCVCEGVAQIENRVELLILQHPQEQDKSLGTARLTCLHLTNAKMRIGLSWPNLAKAVGRDVDPDRWAVLYLGSAQPGELTPGREIGVLDGKGRPVANQESALQAIEGLIVLDGSWSQAKALWWRNPWLLKCRRLVLAPKRPSRYGKLRREPRRESLSTLEAASQALARLEQKPDIETMMLASFEALLARYRALPSPDRRRRHVKAARSKQSAERNDQGHRHEVDD
jgi:DTW domain-containing protein YfiP